jgi:hypothetical protein
MLLPVTCRMLLYLGSRLGACLECLEWLLLQRCPEGCWRCTHRGLRSPLVALGTWSMEARLYGLAPKPAAAAGTDPQGPAWVLTEIVRQPLEGGVIPRR